MTGRASEGICDESLPDKEEGEVEGRRKSGEEGHTGVGGRKVVEVLAGANLHNNKLREKTKDGRGCGKKDV